MNENTLKFRWKWKIQTDSAIQVDQNEIHVQLNSFDFKNQHCRILSENEKLLTGKIMKIQLKFIWLFREKSFKLFSDGKQNVYLLQPQISKFIFITWIEMYSLRQTEARCHGNSAHSSRRTSTWWYCSMLEERISINFNFSSAFCLSFHQRSWWLTTLHRDGCLEAEHHPHKRLKQETKEE